MIDEKLLAIILDREGVGKFDEKGDKGNIFIGDTPTILQNDIDISIKKSGGSRVIKKLTGAKNSYIVVYARGRDYELVNKTLDEIGNKILNKSYVIEDYYIENSFVFSEPSWLEKDDDNIYLFNMTILLTINKIK
jgi:hypothetical protein